MEVQKFEELVKEAQWDSVNDAIKNGFDITTHDKYGAAIYLNMGKVSAEVIPTILSSSYTITSGFINRLVTYGNLEALKGLKENGADLNLKPEVKEDFSAMTGDVVEGVPFSGLDYNYDGEANVYTEIASFLLDSGVEINAQDNTGRTALFYAAIEDNEPLVKFLLENGADKKIKDTQGKRAFHWANKKAIVRPMVK